MDIGLKRQSVDDSIIKKILRFAETRETFTVKELFEAYPNNPDFVLRNGLVNLRIDEKLFMIGNKKGAYYTKDKNHRAEINEPEITPTVPVPANKDIKNIILAKAKVKADWFQTPTLELSAIYNYANISTALHELIAEGKLLVRGSARWTEYRYANGATQADVDKEEAAKIAKKAQDASDKKNEAKAASASNNQTDVKNKILEYIKKSKVVTIPMLIEELDLPRCIMMPYILELEKEEEIWHEGIKRSSKYIHKDVSSSEVENITQKLLAEKRVEQQIDELSEFLCSAIDTRISLGFDSHDVMKIKMFANGSKIQEHTFKNIPEAFSCIKSLTEIMEDE